MSINLAFKTTNLTSIADEVFGSPKRIADTEKLYQDFTTVITMINAWRMDYSNLSAEEKRSFTEVLKHGNDNSLKRKSKTLTSALMHISFAKKGYEKLVDIVLNNGSNEAHDTLEAMQEIFAEEIQIMNKTNYEFTAPLKASGRRRRPVGKTAPSRRPRGHG